MYLVHLTQYKSIKVQATVSILQIVIVYIQNTRQASILIFVILYMNMLTIVAFE